MMADLAQLLLDLADFHFGFANFLLDRLLKLLGRSLDFLLGLAQFFQFDLAIDVITNLSGVALRLADKTANGPCNFG